MIEFRDVHASYDGSAPIPERRELHHPRRRVRRVRRHEQGGGSPPMRPDERPAQARCRPGAHRRRPHDDLRTSELARRVGFLFPNRQPDLPQHGARGAAVRLQSAGAGQTGRRLARRRDRRGVRLRPRRRPVPVEPRRPPAAGAGVHRGARAAGGGARRADHRPGLSRVREGHGHHPPHPRASTTVVMVCDMEVVADYAGVTS